VHVLIVHLHVKPEHIDAFIEATTHNASNSVQEPDIVRFDFFRQKDDPNRFTLVEVYRRPEGHALHRETAHYQTWRDTVADMMAEPRQGIIYTNVFPDDSGWD
jgi:(4S)-4-hydroxy-5-phosphonooxypentane-2,3-dione isomerase